jgi:ATP-dependent DNA helicase RecQ
MPDLDQARRLLRSTFGFNDFRDGQAPVVRALLVGRSALAIFPTGGGKSLCYQLPALLLDGLTVVVSPLIALMRDQVDFLTRRGVAAARLDSSLEPDEVRRVLEDLRAGRLKLLYIAPERLAGERFVQTLAGRPIALLAIDEAHCISEWGHNFRPEYLKLARLADTLRVGRVLALTATATPEVARDIARAFAIADPDVIRTGFHRPNLELHATPCNAGERYELLLDRLESRPPGPTIVYVTLQKTAEDLARALTAAGYPALAYHAGLDAEVRHRVQDEFMQSGSTTVVATIAFGMGIDKADIRAVYHYNLPKGLESYAQEIGRAGRDGLPACCELFACAADMVTLENFAHGDTPTPEAIATFLAEVLDPEGEFDVSVSDLSNAHDIRPLVVQTLLTYLELEGAIESTGPFSAEFKIRLTRPFDEILGRFDERRGEFLRRLLGQARQGRTWLTLDTLGAAEALGEPRGRIVKALGYLEEQGDLVLQLQGMRQGYRRLRPAASAGPDAGPLADALTRRFLDREAREVGRVQQMWEYGQAQGCLTRTLLAYFGEPLGHDCGHCGPCLGESALPLPDGRYRPPGRKARELIARLRAERHVALQTPRQLTRFLCGLASPATSRARLRDHPGFGALADVPFASVHALVQDVGPTP